MSRQGEARRQGLELVPPHPSAFLCPDSKSAFSDDDRRRGAPDAFGEAKGRPVDEHPPRRGLIGRGNRTVGHQRRAVNRNARPFRAAAALRRNDGNWPAVRRRQVRNVESVGVGRRQRLDPQPDSRRWIIGDEAGQRVDRHLAENLLRAHPLTGAQRIGQIADPAVDGGRDDQLRLQRRHPRGQRPGGLQLLLQHPDPVDQRLQRLDLAVDALDLGCIPDCCGFLR